MEDNTEDTPSDILSEEHFRLLKVVTSEYAIAQEEYSRADARMASATIAAETVNAELMRLYKITANDKVDASGRITRG